MGGPDSWKKLESFCPIDMRAEIPIPWHTLEKHDGPRKGQCCTVPARYECTNLERREKRDSKQGKIICYIQIDWRSKTNALTRASKYRIARGDKRQERGKWEALCQPPWIDKRCNWIKQRGVKKFSTTACPVILTPFPLHHVLLTVFSGP